MKIVNLLFLLLPLTSFSQFSSLTTNDTTYYNDYTLSVVDDLILIKDDSISHINVKATIFAKDPPIFVYEVNPTTFIYSSPSYFYFIDYHTNQFKFFKK